MGQDHGGARGLDLAQAARIGHHHDRPGAGVLGGGHLVHFQAGIPGELPADALGQRIQSHSRAYFSRSMTCCVMSRPPAQVGAFTRTIRR